MESGRSVRSCPVSASATSTLRLFPFGPRGLLDQNGHKVLEVIQAGNDLSGSRRRRRADDRPAGRVSNYDGDGVECAVECASAIT